MAEQKDTTTKVTVEPKAPTVPPPPIEQQPMATVPVDKLYSLALTWRTLIEDARRNPRVPPSVGTMYAYEACAEALEELARSHTTRKEE